jgi:hypothetical protein
MRTPKSQEHHRIAAKGASAGNPILGTPAIVLTIGQIVERLRPSNPATVFERLRHWTKEGLISPVDQHHSGTGTPKLYEFDSHSIARSSTRSPWPAYRSFPGPISRPRCVRLVT